jgi:maltose-binding protein MalE
LALAALCCLAACGLLPEGAAVPAPASTAPPTATATATVTVLPLTATATATPTAATPTAPPAASPTPRPAGLTLWTSEQGEALQLVRALASDFSAQSGISVTVEPRPSDDLRVDLIEADLLGEPLPHLIWGNQDDLIELLLDEQLQPIGDTPALADMADPARFVPAALQGARLDGQTWAMPLALQDFFLLLYNQALVPQPPRTSDELITLSRDIARETDYYGLVAAWQEYRWFTAWLNGAGGTLTTADGRQPALDTPAMVGALNLLLELRRAAPEEQQGYADVRALFGAGEAALAVDGDWSLPAYRAQQPPLPFAIAPLPRVPATGRVAAPVAGVTYLMFPRNLAGEQLQDARAFASYALTPAVQLRIARTLQRVPALRAVLAEPDITGDALLAAAAIQAEDAMVLPPTEAARCALWAISQQLPPVLAEELEQQEAAEAMQESAEWCLAN